MNDRPGYDKALPAVRIALLTARPGQDRAAAALDAAYPIIEAEVRERVIAEVADAYIAALNPGEKP